MLLVETFPVGAFGCNCSIVACPDTREAIVIDPGGDPEHVLEVVSHYDLTVKAAIHTHAHLDHIAATRDVKEATGCTIHLHPGDQFLYDGFAMQARMFGWKVRDVLPVDAALAHDETMSFGKKQLRVVHTPGHTPGSVCFELGDETTGGVPLLFAGDTLFRRSIGRTDLPGGDGQLIVRSIRERLWAMNPDTKVVCGHGDGTTIGDEMKKNPFVGGRG